MDFRISFVAQTMEPSDKIIIEDLKRIIMMLAQELENSHVESTNRGS